MSNGPRRERVNSAMLVDVCYTAKLSATHVGRSVNDTYIKIVGVSVSFTYDRQRAVSGCQSGVVETSTPVTSEVPGSIPGRSRSLCDRV